jgi:nicotinamidase-related amidase
MNLLLVLNWCYGIAKPLSPVSCSEVYKVGHQIKMVASLFDSKFVVNDEHGHFDTEFHYLPPHMLHNTSDSVPLDLSLIGLERGKTHMVKKRTLSAMANDQIRGVIAGINPKKTMVAGFNASIDVVATCLGLIDLGLEIAITEPCLGDISLEHKKMALKYLGFMGIPILKDTNESSRFFKR